MTADSGHFRAVTMEDVARAAGVSRALVSLAYRGAKGPSKASVEAILAAGEQLGYRHNANAARLAAKHTGTLGLFILDLANEVFTHIFEGARDAITPSDKHLVLAVGHPDGSDELVTVEGLLGVRVDAAIVAGSRLTDAELTRLAAVAPFVVVSRVVPGVDSVASDDRLGGALATRHLLELGHRSVMHLTPPAGEIEALRSAGYREEMAAAGQQPGEVVTGFTMAAASATAAQLLRSAHRPTAIFADNDLTALGVLTAAAEMGIRVPEDLSVIGYDDTRAAALPGIHLSSVDQQARALGRIAAEYALSALTGSSRPTPRATLLKPTLRPRRTTAAPSR